jgi:hypothetical protein
VLIIHVVNQVLRSFRPRAGQDASYVTYNDSNVQALCLHTSS